MSDKQFIQYQVFAGIEKDDGFLEPDEHGDGLLTMVSERIYHGHSQRGQPDVNVVIKPGTETETAIRALLKVIMTLNELGIEKVAEMDPDDIPF